MYTKERIGSPGTGVPGCYEPPDVGPELRTELSAQGEQQVPLTTEPSLLPFCELLKNKRAIKCAQDKAATFFRPHMVPR